MEVSIRKVLVLFAYIDKGGGAFYKQTYIGIQTYRHTDIQAYRHTGIQTYRHTDIQAYRHTDEQTYRHTDIQTNRHTGIQTYRRTDIQAYRHTDEQTYRHTGIHRNRMNACIRYNVQIYCNTNPVNVSNHLCVCWSAPNQARLNGCICARTHTYIHTQTHTRKHTHAHRSCLPFNKMTDRKTLVSSALATWGWPTRSWSRSLVMHMLLRCVVLSGCTCKRVCILGGEWVRANMWVCVCALSE